MLRTGWSEDGLRQATRDSWESMAWVVFAEPLVEDAKVDLDALAQRLDDQAFENGNPSREAAYMRNMSRIGQARLALVGQRAHQAEVRDLLWPYDDGEERD